MHSLKKPSSLWLSAALDLILPPRCVGSGEIVGAQGTFSPKFWSELLFISNPMCQTCGLPFGIDAGPDALCGSCLEHPPEFDRARAPLIYNDASRDLVLGLKYADRLQTAETLAPLMLRAGTEFMTASHLIIPVPLHPRRLWLRRFNQAAVLGQKIATLSGGTYAPDILQRKENTIPQRGLSRRERNDNVKNAFAVNTQNADRLKNASVILIDDVFTSGATLNACAKKLRQAGASSINVLTIARVTREEF